MTNETQQLEPHPHSRLIDDLGGPAKLVKIVHERTGRKISMQAVSMWRKRGIAYRCRAALALEARDKNVMVPFNFLGERPPQ